MCGIVGCLGHLTVKDEQVFTDMLLLDMIRGPHSTGVLRVGANKHWSFYKDSLNAYNYVNTKDYKDLLRTVNRVLIGHNRWATTGKVEAKNAHPFKHENIIGVHNGTLSWRRELPDYKDFEVDSENIIYSLSKIGVDETWKKIHGAATLVWWDIKENTLNFLRNDERPLLYSLIDKETLYFGSESFIVNAALKRNGKNVSKFETVEEDTLYTIHFPCKKSKEINIITRKVEPRPVVVHNYNWKDRFSRDFDYYGDGNREGDDFEFNGNYWTRKKKSFEKLIEFILTEKTDEGNYDIYKGVELKDNIPVEVCLWDPEKQELHLNKKYRASILAGDFPKKYTVPYSWIAPI